MEQLSSQDELTVRHQFDRLCQLALDGEAVNYHKHLEYMGKHEVNFSDMPEAELNRLSVTDEYSLDHFCFQVLGYDVEVRDMLLAEALQTLTEKKRNVILLSYFMEMSDAEIAREMKLVHSTIREHRLRSLEQLKKIMEGNMDGAEN